ncbi:type 1 fimbrial protein [Escherichia coli]|nr:type 1 fimbrial protein [Escherichia coli]EFA5076158.1 type 1 fimbrial protein [Escherichia coli]
MKKTIVSLMVVSSLFSGAAMATPSENDSSSAVLNFSGRVTSSLCQVDTNFAEQTIELGELSASALNATGAGRAKTFTVGLINCDTSTDSLTYTISDAYTSGSATADYLNPYNDDSSAKGVGVYIASADGDTPVQIGQEYAVDVVKDEEGNALSSQSIALTANIKRSGTNNNTVEPGSVTAKGVITIKATAAQSV